MSCGFVYLLKHSGYFYVFKQLDLLLWHVKSQQECLNCRGMSTIRLFDTPTCNNSQTSDNISLIKLIYFSIVRSYYVRDFVYLLKYILYNFLQNWLFLK